MVFLPSDAEQQTTAKASIVPKHKPIPPEAFYKNHLQPPRNPYAESDARVNAAVQTAVVQARRGWLREQMEMHEVMVRKRLATALQLPTLSKAPDKYLVKVQVEGITSSSAM